MEKSVRIVAEFKVNCTQFLDVNGSLVQDLPDFLQDQKKIIEFYCAMAELREFDAIAIALQRTGKIGTYPSTLGQEAISIGIGAAMEPEDIFCPYYRDCGAQFWRGVKMSEILLYWGGDERGSNFSGNKQDFPLCVPVASQVLHAVGVANAIKLKKESKVVVTVVGDGGTSRGDFYEAINLAGVWQLPVVFVINNNQWAISVPRSEQTMATTLAQKGIAAGIDNEQVDGNDVIAVCYSIRKAVEKARNRQGPTLIEALSYRLSDHTTADDAKRYRNIEELQKQRLADPLLRLHQYLISKHLWNEKEEVELKNKVTNKVESAVEEYLNINSENALAMFDYLYAKLPAALASQREECLRLFGES